MSRAEERISDGKKCSSGKDMEHQDICLVGDRPVLVPVDFSPESESAVLFAASLVEDARAPLVILHVAHEPSDKPGFYRREGKRDQVLPLEDIAVRMLDDFMEGIERRYPSVRTFAEARRMVVRGLPANRIIEVGERVSAQWIVLGSNGRSTLGKLLWGCVTDEVARKSEIPVSVVHHHGHCSGNVGFFVDSASRPRKQTGKVRLISGRVRA